MPYLTLAEKPKVTSKPWFSRLLWQSKQEMECVYSVN